MAVLLSGLVFWNSEYVGAWNGDLKVAEAALTERLVNMLAQAKIDMLASEDGVDVRLWAEPPSDVEETQQRVDEHGVSIASYGLSVITDVKRKYKHIEVHLNGGGWSGRVPAVPWLVARSAEETALGLPARPKSATEIRRRRAGIT